MRQSPAKPSDNAEIELIRSLYDALVPAAIMSLGFLLCGGLILARYPDPLLEPLYIGGVIASVLRLSVAFVDAAKARHEDLTIIRARALEQRFAITYLLFALMLGLFEARALMLGIAPVELPTMVMVIGYGAGVASGVGLRPRVAVAAMTIGISPAAVVLVSRLDALHGATGVFTAALLVGGIGSVRRRHRATLADIERRTAFATLARRDDLTAIPNRLGLREWYAHRVRGGRSQMLAVHCLDLDGFKPVNDRHGHPVGDLLLVAVARRLEHAIRESDVAARLGGDEFAIVQLDVVEEEQAQQLADRLVAAIAQPFEIDGLILRISTCVGFIVARDAGIETLLNLADEALYDAKRAGPGRATRLDRSDVPDWIA